MRLVRALEIYRNSGLPPSEAFRLSRSPFAGHHFIRVGLQVDRDKLYRAIDAPRGAHAGRRPGRRGQGACWSSRPASCPPFRSLGYKEILAHLRGEMDLATATELIQRHSRQFAKRQLSWFRQEKDIHWFPAEDEGAIIGFIQPMPVERAITCGWFSVQQKDSRDRLRP